MFVNFRDQVLICNFFQKIFFFYLILFWRLLCCVCVCVCAVVFLITITEGGWMSGDRQLYQLIKSVTQYPSSEKFLWLSHDLKVTEKLPLSTKGKARAWIR